MIDPCQLKIIAEVKISNKTNENDLSSLSSTFLKQHKKLFCI